MGADPSMSRLDVFKALGDNTRYAIYLELARSRTPLSTATISETLGLHPNTVRPHLERMRDVGLLDVRPETTRSVGRPQHLYSLAADAPSLGLEPPVYPIVAAMLLRMASAAALGRDEALDAGRVRGRAIAVHLGRSNPLEAVVTMHEELGFDPMVVESPDGPTVAFARCPLEDLAAENPEIVCSLHRGLIQGCLEECPAPELRLVDREFHDRTDREPCLVRLGQPAAGD